MSENHGGTAVRRTELDAIHDQMGASFTEFAGWRLPLRFSGELAEHQAVRIATGIFDISHMGQLSVLGPDAAKVVARAVVSDVSTLAIGAARYTMLCNEGGGVLDDLIVYRLGEDDYFVIANAANTAVVVGELERAAAEADAAVHDMTAGRTLISVQGPESPDALAGLLDAGVALPRRFRVIRALVAGNDALVARTGYTGEDGFEISVERGGGVPIWQALLDEGTVPVGLAARDSLRLEAGLPLYGHELGPVRSPYAAGLGRVVDLEHHFVGHDALARIAVDGERDTLVGLVCDGRRSPRQEYTVHDSEGREVGVVTSGVPSPTLGRPIALAYVQTASSSVGTSLTVDVRGRMEGCEVVALPFVKRTTRSSP